MIQSRAHRIAELLKILREAEQELQSLTDGQVDGAEGSEARSHSLQLTAQEQLRLGERTQRALAETQLGILNALPAHIALLDSNGVILEVNEAWRRFASANVLRSSDFYVGHNYLAICEGATGECSEEAAIVVQGIRDVLSGTSAMFALEYPCHSPEERRWFRLMVTPLTTRLGSGAVVMHVNVTERREAEEALKERELQQRLLAKSLREETRRLHESQAVANVGSWETDLHTLQVKWSEETFRIFGMNPQDFLPSHAGFMQLVHPDDRTAVDDAFRDSLRQEGTFSIQHRVGAPGDATRYVEERWYVHRDSAGRAVSAVGTCQDISVGKQAQQAILQLNSELEDRVAQRTRQLEVANKELEAFSYSVSHDLRSPLATIAGFSQTLLSLDGDRLSERGSHYLHRIRASANKMSELIDGFLSLAQISRATLRRREVNLSEMSSRLVQELRDAEPDRVVDVHVQADLMVHGDPAMLAVIMQNLIGNAWKYSTKTPHARVEIGSESGQHGEPCIFVRDNGAGFDMAHADRLFEAFARLHKDTEFTGTGIGLANVKRAVERHGGRVWAQASPGDGATFRFTFPG